jgi:hypothetical protein
MHPLTVHREQSSMPPLGLWRSKARVKKKLEKLKRLQNSSTHAHVEGLA